MIKLAICMPSGSFMGYGDWEEKLRKIEEEEDKAWEGYWKEMLCKEQKESSRVKKLDDD